MVFLWLSHENGGFSIVNHLADPGESFSKKRDRLFLEHEIQELSWSNTGAG